MPCLPAGLNENIDMCFRLNCCIDQKLQKCFAPLQASKSGCPTECDIPHNNVIPCRPGWTNIDINCKNKL